MNKWKTICFILLILGIGSQAEMQSRISATAKSLSDQVIIRRDTYGVPHILAETEEAGAFAMGYAQAEDHCIEIARRFISARGEEAKNTGSGLNSDIDVKRYGIYDVAREKFGSLSPVSQKMLTAYAEGFNRYVEKNHKDLPSWIPKFDGVDVLARSRQEVFRFSFNRGNIIRAIQQKYSSDSQTGHVVSPYRIDNLIAQDHETEDMNGSNLWSLHGSRTTSGKTILLGNPHQAWSVLYWEAHITVPGKINFYGSTFVGRPMLTTGFNENLGWTHTVNNIDLEDVYALRLDPGKQDHYIVDGKPYALTKKEITVEVKGSSEKRTFWYSHLGPVVHRTRDTVFTLKSPILDEYRFYDGWYALSKAVDWNEFHALLKKNLLPMFNLGYADVAGNIYYLWNGMVPVRVDDGTDYKLDVSGDTGKYFWSHLHATDDLPQLFNPGGGYVQNCNDAPWWTSLRNIIDPRKYPSYIEPGVPLRLRSQMSLEMLEGQKKFSIEDVIRLKFNTKMLLADRVKPALIKAVKNSGSLSEELKSGLAIMESWDNRVSAESRGGVLFQRFWDTYSDAVKQPFAVDWSADKPASTPYGISDASLAIKHFEDAVKWTRKKYGSENVTWGNVHRVRLGDLDLPATGASGSYGLFHVVGFSEAPDGRRVVGTIDPEKPLVGGGDGWIFVVEFSKPLVAWSLLAYGNSSNGGYRYGRDQARLFAENKMKRVRFTEAEIKANLEREYKP